MSKHILHNLQFVSPNTATGLVADVYQQIKGDMMLVPEPFLVHSPAPELLAGSWSLFREALESGSVPRGHKETVAVAIARINECPWCVDSHSITLHATGLGDVVDSVQSGDLSSIADSQARGLMQWAQATRQPGAAILLDPPFSAAQGPEIVGTALMFHYLTRIVNVTLAETPLPTGGWLGSTMKKGLGLLFRGKARGNYPAGQSLAFLPAAALPADLEWAADSSAVAGALARFHTAVESGAERTLPVSVQDLVRQCIYAWQGEEMGLSLAWVDEKVAGLSAEDRPVAKLTLLSALASHQVDSQLISDFRAARPGDQHLLEAVAWGSFQAARQISSWLV